MHNPKWPSIELLYKNVIFKRHFFHLLSCSGVNHKHFLEVQVQNGSASVKKPIDDQLQKLAESRPVLLMNSDTDQHKIYLDLFQFKMV